MRNRKVNRVRKFYFVKGQVPGAAFLLAMGAGIFFTCQLQTVCAKYQYQESRIDIIYAAKTGNDRAIDTVQNADMLQSADIILPSDFRGTPAAFSDGTTWEEENMVDYGFVSELNEIPTSPFHDKEWD